MEKLGVIKPDITPDVEAPAQQCNDPGCVCRGSAAVKKADVARPTIESLDSDFRRAAADLAKKSLS